MVTLNDFKRNIYLDEELKRVMLHSCSNIINEDINSEKQDK
jgi:hypothetical protein